MFKLFLSALACKYPIEKNVILPLKYTKVKIKTIVGIQKEKFRPVLVGGN